MLTTLTTARRQATKAAKVSQIALKVRGVEQLFESLDPAKVAIKPV